jgi:hypothetical protein
MSVSGIMDMKKNTILDTMVPPRIVEKGGLITGNNYDWGKGIMPEKVAVPPGENGTFLQADSTTETGLKWTKIPIPDEIDELMKSAIIEELQFQRKQISALKTLLLPEINKKNVEHNSSIPGNYFIVTHNHAEYKIPYNPSMTVKDVIDYMNTNYYISLINDDGCLDIILFFGSRQLTDLQEPITKIGIQTDSVIRSVCGGNSSKFNQLVDLPQLVKKGGKRRITKTKRRNKSYRK